jgi:hypothetical protein
LQAATPCSARTAPIVQPYQTPTDAAAVKPTFDASKTAYKTPAGASDFTARNLDQGLLEYDPANSKNLTFDGRDVNASNIGANINNVTPDFQTSDKFLTDGAFVENRVNNLMSQDNELNQRARTQGVQQAAGMGLANTTMAATIGQANMIDKALAIATPDATTTASADLARQGATYQSQRANQDAQNQGSLAEQTARINSELNTQKAGQEWDATNQKSALQADLNKQTANIAGAQATQNAGYQADSQVRAGLLEGAGREQQGNISGELAAMESMSAQNLTILQDKLQSAGRTTDAQNQAIMAAFSAQQEIIKTQLSGAYTAVVAQAQLNAGQRDSLAGVMSEMANNYEISVQNIMLDPNLEADAKNAAIERINRIFNQDMANIASVFGASYANTTAA